MRIATKTDLAENRNALRTFSSESGSVQDERNFALSLIKRPDKPVLDVGTGAWACTARHLIHRGYRVVGSDHDRVVLRAAKRFLARSRPSTDVTFIHDGITHSRLALASFLNVVCFNVLRYVAGYPDAVAELHRILAPEGSAGHQ